MNADKNDELFEQLRAANPYVDEGTTPNTAMRKSARFEEITMKDQDTITAPQRTSQPGFSWWRQPKFAIPVAAFVALMLVAGALAFNVATAPSAYALVNEAARTTASFDSGRVEVEIDLRETPDDESGSFSLDYLYQGDDFSLEMDLGETDPFDQEVANFTMIQVGDEFYSEVDSGKFIGGSVADGALDMLSELGFGVNPDSITADSVIPILEQADDFKEVDSGDDGTSYRGSVNVSVLQEIGAENLPPGLSLLASDGDRDLPEMIDVTVTVAGSQIENIVIHVIGDTAEGYTDVLVTTTFSEVGQPQAIEAPADDQIVDVMDTLPEGSQEAFVVLEELEARRPGLCQEIWESLEEADIAEFDEFDFEATVEEYETCLRNEGENEAADAFRAMSDLES